MTCYGPLTAYSGKKIGESGKRSLVFDARKAFDGRRIMLPCGKCIGCRVERARVWAVRCMHEKRLHRDSCFLTLTYEEKQMPVNGSLVKRDLQLFMKRLRLERPAGLRFFACGEYGSQTHRPHYHVLLLNTDFYDKRRAKISKSGAFLFTSDELSKLWTAGQHWIGACTFDSCAYVAGYCCKSVGAGRSYVGREPEFVVMSRRPGIGAEWFAKYQEETYRHYSVIMNSREMKVPRYYDEKFKDVDEFRLFEVKKERMEEALARPDDSTRARLRVREKVALAKFRLFAREL